jgi:hypothetical protein
MSDQDIKMEYSREEIKKYLISKVGGNEDFAEHHLIVPLQAFGDKTAEELIKQGMSVDVMGVLRRIWD